MDRDRREAVLRAYGELRLTHPELPAQLREFQVVCLTKLQLVNAENLLLL